MRVQASIVFIFGCALGVLLIPAGAADPFDHWTSASNSLPSSVTSIAFGHGRFVAVGSLGLDAGWISSSTDLMQWTPATCADHLCTPPAMLAVTFANGRFLAVGNYGWTYRSTNGFDWELSVVPPSDSLLQDVCSADGEFVAVGDIESCPCGFLATSPDGAQWNSTYVENILTLRSVAFGKGKLVAVGLSDYGIGHTRSNLFSSTNLFATWRSYAVTETNDLFSVAYGNDVFVAAGAEHFSGNGRILTSLDGANWSVAALPTTNALRSISFVEGIFIAGGSSGALLTSTNGSDWQLRTSPTSGTLGRSVLAHGRFFALADATLLESDPLLSLQIAFTTQPELIVSGMEGRSYRIEAAASLTDQIWDNRGTFVLYTSPTLWREGLPAGSRRFYRAILLP